MTRASRIFHAVGLAYISQAATILVSLWLTPFLLRRLGQHDYGLWLLALQLTSYLALLDLGVVTLLSREAAFALGKGGQSITDELPTIVGRTIRVVLCQLPVVACFAAVAIVLVPQEWMTLRGPLTLIAASFVLMFPLRIPHALLQGLQELTYLGRVSLLTWSLGTVTTIGLVYLGSGLYAVAIGWFVSQASSAILWGIRIRSRYPSVVPRILPSISPREFINSWLEKGVWVSIAQVARLMLAGTDLLIIAKVLGPNAVVPFAITGKLVQVLTNQPQAVMQLAQPALSESRASSDGRERLMRMTVALTQCMLLISGAVFILILVVNRGFVSWWISPAQFSGLRLTIAMLTCMLLRHWNDTAVYAIFAFGHERRIAVTTLLDGFVTVALSLLLVQRLGVIGVVIGSIFGVCAVSLPGNMSALKSETAASYISLLEPIARWFVRLVALAVCAATATRFWAPDTLLSLGLTSLITILVYALVMISEVRRPPFGTYFWPRVTATYKAMSQRVARSTRT